MRRFFLSLIVLLFSLPACAQNDVPPAGSRGEPVNVTIFGKSYELVPFQMSGTNMGWSDVEDDLPAVILSTPTQPMTDQEIMDSVNKIAAETSRRYEKAIEVLAEKYAEDNPGISADYAATLFSDKFPVGQGAQYSSEEYQHYHDSYLAMMYLSDMLREKLTGEPPAY